MRTPKWLAALGIGALVLTGVVIAAPIVGFAQDTGTPPSSERDEEGLPLGDPTLDPAIGLIEAQEIALTGQDGAVVRAVELEGENGVLVWEVELDNGVEVEIDGATGEVLETEQDDDDDDDDDDDEDDDDDDDD